ncbi:MAG TPA: hypothetical protein VK975_06940 [Acidimicrobiales bacterium]|nr:hypothetical protein [Acidimicrobiales bacterium]
MKDCGHDNVRIGIVLEIDDTPVTLYVWAHLLAETLVEELRDHGVDATFVRIDVDDASDYAS